MFTLQNNYSLKLKKSNLKILRRSDCYFLYRPASLDMIHANAVSAIRKVRVDKIRFTHPFKNQITSKNH